MAIGVNEGEDTIYASGVDNKVISIRKLPPNSKDRWVLSKKMRDHTHDVRALALGPQGLLVTGGVDTNLIVYSTLDFGQSGAQVRKIPPFPQQPFISMAPSAAKALALSEMNRTATNSTIGESTGNSDGKRPNLLRSVLRSQAHQRRSSAVLSTRPSVTLISMKETSTGWRRRSWMRSWRARSTHTVTVAASAALLLSPIRCLGLPDVPSTPTLRALG